MARVPVSLARVYEFVVHLSRAAPRAMATDNVTFVLVQGTEQRARELPKTTTLQDLAELLRSDAEITTTF
eukprot:1212950-Prymnesium_polylepis.1